MSALAEFLRSKATEDAITRTSNQDMIAEWREAIKRLLDTIQTWIAESDPERRLKLTVREHEVNEESLGKYIVPSLEISGFGKTVWVTPKARHTIATARALDGVNQVRAAGRLNLTDGVNPIALYRFRSRRPDEPDVWMWDDPKLGMDFFEREDFEAAVVSYLK